MNSNERKAVKIPRNIYLVLDVDTREVQSVHPSRDEARLYKRQFQLEDGAGYTILKYAIDSQVR